MSGGKSALLHHIFQKQGITPDKVLAMPEGLRAFLFASTIIMLESKKRK